MTACEVTPENEGLLRTGYVMRQEGELAVLSRWFPADSMGQPAVAPYLDVILYSRDQIRKENKVSAKLRESVHRVTLDSVSLHISDGSPLSVVLLFGCQRPWENQPRRMHRGELSA
jgi:hypothetical protein